MTYVPPEMNEEEQPRSYSEQISRIPSGWEDNRWRRLCVILDAVDGRLNRLETQERHMHLYYDASNGWSQQNGTIDEAIADIRREGNGAFTIEEDNRLGNFRVVSGWLVANEDGKGDECFFIESI